jgi:sulfur carrier protein ThiS
MLTVKIAGGILLNSENQKTFTMDFSPVTLKALLKLLEIEEHHVGAILVNGRPRKLSETFEDHVEIQILPVLSGG